MAKQTNLYVDYHLGLLKVLQRIREKYPNVVIQDCASGGGRANYGLLPYFDEFWVSDNTDALQRVYIQWGTSLFFPANAMAAHINHCPYWNTGGRVIPVKFRCDVAMSGRLGIELQPKDMTQEERSQVETCFKDYKEIRTIVQTGDLYRLISPYDKRGVVALMYKASPPSEGSGEAVLFIYKTANYYNQPIPRIRLAGLEPSKTYTLTEKNVRVGQTPCGLSGKQFSGKFLMDVGIEVPLWEDYASRVFELKKPAETTMPQSQQLEERLCSLLHSGYMAGHQDDPFYGIGWAYEEGRSDVLQSVGDYPAVMGFELGGVEMGDEKNLDSVPFTRIHDELIAHHERGGIVTLSWHPRNPLTGGTAWDTSDSTVVHSMLEGGKCHQLFLTWMERLGDFMATLTDSDGKPVPVIFRPWHENNGSWFWWGQDLCSDEEFKELWNLLQDYMNERGLNNLLWSYSPNLDGGWTLERFLKRYPGNDRVALLGVDAYQWGTEEEFVRALTADLDFLSQFAKDNGKLIALTECGLQNMPDSTWYSRVLKPVMDQYPICYFLLWRNAGEHEFFGPVPTRPCADDFKKLYEAENVLFLKDIVK
jgi:hypothetical protein